MQEVFHFSGFSFLWLGSYSSEKWKIHFFSNLFSLLHIYLDNFLNDSILIGNMEILLCYFLGS